MPLLSGGVNHIDRGRAEQEQRRHLFEQQQIEKRRLEEQLREKRRYEQQQVQSERAAQWSQDRSLRRSQSAQRSRSAQRSSSTQPDQGTLQRSPSARRDPGTTQQHGHRDFLMPPTAKQSFSQGLAPTQVAHGTSDNRRHSFHDITRQDEDERGRSRQKAQQRVQPSNLQATSRPVLTNTQRAWPQAPAPARNPLPAQRPEYTEPSPAQVQAGTRSSQSVQRSEYSHLTPAPAQVLTRRSESAQRAEMAHRSPLPQAPAPAPNPPPVQRNEYAHLSPAPAQTPSRSPQPVQHNKYSEYSPAPAQAPARRSESVQRTEQAYPPQAKVQAPIHSQQPTQRNEYPQSPPVQVQAPTRSSQTMQHSEIANAPPAQVQAPPRARSPYIPHPSSAQVQAPARTQAPSQGAESDHHAPSQVQPPPKAGSPYVPSTTKIASKPADPEVLQTWTKDGKTIQRVKVPGWATAGATAAGTALVEKVLTNGGEMLGQQFVQWWNDEPEKADQPKADPPVAPQKQAAPQQAPQQQAPQQQPAPQQAPQQQSFDQPSPAISKQPQPQVQPTPQQPAHTETESLEPPQHSLQEYQSSPLLSPIPNTTTSQPQTNVLANESLIFPTNFRTSQLLAVSWLDGAISTPTIRRIDYMVFTSWNKSAKRTVLTFVPQKVVRQETEEVVGDRHFARMYPGLWRDLAGEYPVIMDDKWQYGQLGSEDGERFVVYQEHMFPGLYNTSFTNALWRTTDDHASALTPFGGGN